MKLAEREEAVKLRKQGLTYPEICKRLRVSKGSLSLWLRNVSYAPSRETLSRRRLANFRNAQLLHERKIQRVSRIVEKSKKEVPSVKSNGLQLLGIMAYWTEGSKTQDNLVQFTNSDPVLIELILRWLRESCGVPEKKLRVHLRAHPDVDKKKAELYWSKITKIPLSQFHKTTFKISGSNGRRYDKLGNGIARITVCDTDLHYRIKGWIKGLADCIKN